MTTTPETPEQILCSNPACPLLCAHSGPCAPKEWGVTSEQIVTRVLAELEKIRDTADDGGWGTTFHRHGMSNEVHRDVDECVHPGRPRQVYVFDPEYLAEHDAWVVRAALRAAGLLVDAPNEERIERAARAIFEEERNFANEPWPVWDELGEPTPTFDPRDPYRDLARAALAAGAAPEGADPCAVEHPLHGGRCNLPTGHEPGHICGAPQEPSEIQHVLAARELHRTNAGLPAPPLDREKRWRLRPSRDDGYDLSYFDGVRTQGWWLSRAQVNELMSGLVAAGPGREKLIAEAGRLQEAWEKVDCAFSETEFLESDALAELHATGVVAVHCARRLADALAATVEVDESKLTEVRNALDEADQSVAWAHGDDWTPAAKAAHNRLRRSVDEWLRGGR